jgi:hypothetical protein
LIAAGYQYQQVMDFTLHQVMQFLASAERMKRQERMGDAIAARMAQAEPKAWKAYMKQFEKR